MNLLYMNLILLLVIITLLVSHGRMIDEIRKRSRTLGRMEIKLDLLLQQSNIEFERYKGLPPDVVAALCVTRSSTRLRRTVPSPGPHLERPRPALKTFSAVRAIEGS